MKPSLNNVMILAVKVTKAETAKKEAEEKLKKLKTADT